MSLRISTAPHAHNPITTQRLMLFVVIALLPTAAAGVYAFGIPALTVLMVSCATAVLSELVWQLIAKQEIRIDDYSALVTGLILGLNLPSTAPWWMAMIGSAFAVLIVKQLFGGLGDNFLNPALAARAVLLASWPKYMTAVPGPVPQHHRRSVQSRDPAGLAVPAHHRHRILADPGGDDRQRIRIHLAAGRGFR